MSDDEPEPQALPTRNDAYIVDFRVGEIDYENYEMKNCRYGHAVITLLGKVFVFGGKRNENDNVCYIMESE